MRSLTSWLSVMFLGMFWVFRVATTLATQYGENLGGFIVFNNTIEIALLFISIFCFILVVRRIIWGPIIYLVGYGLYFGSYIVSNFIPTITSGETMDISIIQNSFVGFLALLLGLITLIDIAYEKVKMKHFSDNKTDWYFDNEKYDRKMDERADKNQYKML